jgi:ABC-type Fe3+-hydroxamate transport system substrate-binding protein
MVITDQIGHQLNLKSVPKRIISLVPSQTELLFDLGLDKEVVGITKFCIYPQAWFATKDKVGGTKNLNLSKITNLEPDLIIANKEENTKEQIQFLQKLYPVYTTNISSLDESIKMIRDVGEVTNKEDCAKLIITNIQSEFKRLESIQTKTYSTLYLIWKEPFMSINQNTFINDMMKRCGFKNIIFGNTDYPTLTIEQISELQPELIFLSSEPYPFKEKHIEEFQNACKKSKIILVNGEYFSWYGSRLQQAVIYFIGLMDKIS